MTEKGELVTFFLILSGIFLLVGTAELLRHRLNWPAEFTRKLVHLGIGVMILFLPRLFTSTAPLIWMSFIFILITAVGLGTGKLPGLHGTGRPSCGTVLYPLTFFILVLVFWPGLKSILILSMLLLAFGDGLAAITGESLPHPHEFRLGRDKKSLEGSAVMFLVSFLTVTVLLPRLAVLDGYTISFTRAAWIGLLTALPATVVEALSSRGWDNLTAPFTGAFILWLTITQPQDDVVRLTLGMGLALIVVLISLKARFLSPGGGAATFILASLIFGVGGWIWSLPILTFFLTSSLLSHLGRSRKAKIHQFEKGGQRDLGQVLANGLAAGVILLSWRLQPYPFWFSLYLGALAAVNADTWATEIGVFSKGAPRSLRNFRRVETGTSGAISLMGTLAALMGSGIIALSGWLVSGQPFLRPTGTVFWLITGAGLAGSLLDSLLGATLQAQFQCAVCGRKTEKPICCLGKEIRKISGLIWMRNDQINAICSLAGALLVALAGFNVLSLY